MGSFSKPCLLVAGTKDRLVSHTKFLCLRKETAWLPVAGRDHGRNLLSVTTSMLSMVYWKRGRHVPLSSHTWPEMILVAVGVAVICQPTCPT